MRRAVPGQRGLFEVLGELEALALVVGLEVAAVQDFRHLGDPLVDQAPHDLAVLQDEGHLVRS
jgi:hypothetical protein